ncbi:MAG: hypothetical protein ACNS63_05065 [Candidatus Nitrospinota bacterium M3_3B_026]
MMRIIKKLLGWALGLLVFLGLAALGLYFMIYDSRREFMADFEEGGRKATLALYNMGYVEDLSPSLVRYVYQKSCYRQCHGEAAMITAVLGEAGWIQVVERMRVKENVNITGREADVIIQYLEEKYPNQETGYSYKIRKAVHHAVWRNDMGHGDIYGDIIYATPAYLKSIGADHLIGEYDLDNYHVFIVSFTVHEGEIEPAPLDEVCLLRSPNGRIEPTPPWELRFQTADKHHWEGIVRFAKRPGSPVVGPDTEWMELVIKGVGGAGKRVYRWDLPIKYPPEVVAEVGEDAV